MCRKCGQKYAQELGLCRTCSRALSAPPVPPVTRIDPVTGVRTVISDGVEYEAISIGSQPVTRAWPMGSALADPGMKVHQP